MSYPPAPPPWQPPHPPRPPRSPLHAVPTLVWLLAAGFMLGVLIALR